MTNKYVSSGDKQSIVVTGGPVTQGTLDQMAVGCPTKRLAEPQEVVNTMILILSPGNSYMTGQSIAVDGGVTAW